MIERGAVHWADLGEPRGSRPAKRRPVLVVQADGYNASRLRTVVVAVITPNTAIAEHAGNVFLPAGMAGLHKDSVVNVTSLLTLDKSELDPPVGRVSAAVLHRVDTGLRAVLDL